MAIAEFEASKVIETAHAKDVGHLEQTVPSWPQNPEEICACSFRIGSGKVLHHTAGEHITEGVISERQVVTVSDQKPAGKFKPASNLSRSNYGSQRRGNSDAVDSLSRCRKSPPAPMTSTVQQQSIFVVTINSNSRDGVFLNVLLDAFVEVSVG